MADFGAFLSNVALGAGRNIQYSQAQEERQASLDDLKSQTASRKANSDLLAQDFMLRSGLAQRQAQAAEQKKRDLADIATATSTRDAVEASPVQTAMAEADMWNKRSSELWKKGYTAEAELASKESKRAADKAKEFGQIAKEQKASRIENLGTAANDVLTAMKSGGLTPELAKAYYTARAEAGQPPSDKDYELDSPKGQAELIIAAQKSADVRKLRESESKMLNAEARTKDTQEYHQMMANATMERARKAAEKQNGVTVPDIISKSKASGQEFLDVVASEDQGLADLVKGVADNRISLSTLSNKGGHREKIASMVLQYKPEYDSKEMPVMLAGEKGYTSGKQGQQVKSFNVAINHLGTLGKVADALQANDSQTLNKLTQSVGKEFGDVDITNFESVKKIVADELVKAIVGGGASGAGALADREAAAETIKASKSPAQLKGTIDQYIELMHGQLEGSEKNYEASTGKKDFADRFLTMSAKDTYKSKGTKGASVFKELPAGFTEDK